MPSRDLRGRVSLICVTSKPGSFLQLSDLFRIFRSEPACYTDQILPNHPESIRTGHHALMADLLKSQRTTPTGGGLLDRWSAERVDVQVRTIASTKKAQDVPRDGAEFLVRSSGASCQRMRCVLQSSRDSERGRVLHQPSLKKRLSSGGGASKASQSETWPPSLTWPGTSPSTSWSA